MGNLEVASLVASLVAVPKINKHFKICNRYMTQKSQLNNYANNLPVRIDQVDIAFVQVGPFDTSPAVGFESMTFAVDRHLDPSLIVLHVFQKTHSILDVSDFG